MTPNDPNSRKLADFERQIAELEESVRGLGHRVATAHPDRSLVAYQAEWHIRGVIYHLRRLFEMYAVFTRKVGQMAADTGAQVIYLFAPSFQPMLFEFYALVNLCRISLDNLRIFLKPLFKPSSHQLPKSVRDVMKGKSDCPIYNALS
jgi:hypothetical protein